MTTKACVKATTKPIPNPNTKRLIVIRFGTTPISNNVTFSQRENNNVLPKIAITVIIPCKISAYDSGNPLVIAELNIKIITLLMQNNNTLINVYFQFLVFIIDLLALQILIKQ